MMTIGAVGKALAVGMLGAAAALGTAGPSAAANRPLGTVQEEGRSYRNDRNKAHEDAMDKMNAACDRLGGSSNATFKELHVVKEGSFGYLSYYVKMGGQCQIWE